MVAEIGEQVPDELHPWAEQAKRPDQPQWRYADFQGGVVVLNESLHRLFDEDGLGALDWAVFGIASGCSKALTTWRP